MPNHIHLLVQEKVDGGSGLFTKRVLGGYTQSFNQKNKRSGVLFQGRTKKILINKDAHFMHLPYYLLTNPLNLIYPKWKEIGIKDSKKAMKFLDTYKWGSFRDLSSSQKGIFSEVINKKLFLELFGFKTENKFKEFFNDWLKERN